MYAHDMRTTIDLPDDLHRRAMSIARDTSRSLSETVADLMRRGLGQGPGREISRSEVTGLPLVRLGSTITTDEVRALDDEQ
jgi:hypothetical protein